MAIQYDDPCCNPCSTESSPDRDPWKGRSTGMRCLSCAFYVQKNAESPVLRLVGRCRRHAPTMSGYPVVFPEDWCGDHKLNEEAL